MTELQLGLIALGTLAVVGVFGFNTWQEHRQRKLAQAALKPPHEDILLKGRSTGAPLPDGRSEPDLNPASPRGTEPRVEPVLGEPGRFDLPEAPSTPVIGAGAVRAVQAESPLPAQSDAVEAPASSGLATAVTRPSAPAVRDDSPVDHVSAESGAGPVPPELLDARLEFIVAMDLVEPVSSMQIMQSQRATLQRLNKPVLWVGFNERTREWQGLTQDAEFGVRHLRVGLQLVNRLGPVSESDLAVFTGAMQALADELMAVADMPPMRVLDQAAEIDRFCAAVDLEIGLNLVSRGSAFAGTKIRALAEAAGMTLGADGVFTRFDDDGRAQFSLQNYENTRFSPEALRALTTHGLTFLLDVPRVDHGERVFAQMSEVAKRFADTLQGALVDDNRQPLSDVQLDHIRREFIGKPQATMAGFGLPAGSPQALRLFS